MDFPRFVGNPGQYFLKTEREFRDFLNFNNGKSDCFWCHNSTWEIDKEKYSFVRTVPFDFDDKAHMENAYEDCLAVWKLGLELGIPVFCVFTTNKGFHAYLIFKPVLAKRNHGLRAVYKAIQLFVVERIKAKSWDKQLFGDTRRMMRIPGTIHPKTKLWCMSFDPGQMTLPDLLEACKTQQPVHDFPEGRETVTEFIKRLGLKLDVTRHIDYSGSPFAHYEEKKGDFDEYLRNVIPRKCIHNAMMTNNPPHPVRREAALTLAQTGYDVRFAINFMGRVSTHYDWVNRDPDIQNYHIRDLFGRPDYKLHSCARLREEGLCIGKTCELFEMAFGDDGT